MKQSSAKRWAANEFRTLDLGDRRRDARTIALAAAAAETPNGRITQVTKGAAEQEAAFRWARNSAIEASALAEASGHATAERCSAHPMVFVAVDQMTVKLVDRAKTKGFGHVGRGGLSRRCRGLQVMTALAMTPAGGTLGTLGQEWWARSDEPSPAPHKDKRPVQERESGLWTGCLKQALKAMASAAPQTRPWFQLDRGADAHHVLKLAAQEQLLITIRSSYNRRLAGQKPKYIRDCMAHTKPCGFITLKFNKQRSKRLKRSHGRPIKLATTYVHTTLLVTDAITGKKFEMPINVVRVRECRTPKGVERIEWWLLTTSPVKSFEDAKLVVDGYTYRWRIEEYHRTWKTGACNLTSSQLRSRANFQRWATILSAVATRIERLKFLARNEPNRPAIEVLSRDEIDAAILRTKTRKFRPGDPLTIAEAVHLIAVVGGYTGNRKAGPPGTVTIRRGLQRVEDMALGMELARICD